MNTRDWLFAASVYLLCLSLMTNVIVYVQLQEAEKQRAEERSKLQATISDLRAEVDQRDADYRNVRLQLDAANAQLAKYQRVKRSSTPRPVPVFERGRRFD